MSGFQTQTDTIQPSTQNTIPLDALNIPTSSTAPVGFESSPPKATSNTTIALDSLASTPTKSSKTTTTLAEIEPIQEAQKLIPSSIATTKKEEEKPTETLSFDTSKFSITIPTPTTPTEAISPTATQKLMGDSHPAPKPQPSADNSKLSIGISQFVITAGIIIGIIAYSIQRYLTYASSYPIDPNYQSTIETIAYYEQEANNILGFNGYNDFVGLSFSTPNGISNLQSIINATSINYIHKKNIIAQQFDALSRQLINTINETDRLKTIIATHGGMDKTSYDLIKQNSSFSIQQSLSTVEIIKLSTALKTFYYLDSFINQFAAAIELEPSVVKQQMERMIARGEIDIKRYIESCYINPFEQERECNATQDFVRQYEIFDSKTQIDPQFVIALLGYINQKLEQSTIPNLIINFSNFDPRSDSLTLNIEINTFQEDELALISKGILNPHIFVVTNLINLLKQSTLIKDSGIDVKTLKINKKNIKIGSTEFTVNNSLFSFTVPIQQPTSRDISDYSP